MGRSGMVIKMDLNKFSCKEFGVVGANPLQELKFVSVYCFSKQSKEKQDKATNFSH